MRRLETKCIYSGHNPDCFQTGKMTREHTLAEAFGKFQGMPTLTGRVCERCNKRMDSEFEVQEYRVGLLGHLRWIAGIYSDPDERSPFYNRAGGVGPSDMTVTIPITGDQLLGETEFGTKTGTHRRQVVLRKSDGAAEHIPVRNWAEQRDELVKQIRALVREGYTEVGTHHSPDEDDDVRALCRALGGDVDIREYDYAPGPSTFVIQYSKPPLWRVAAKSAFHYALTQFPTITGHEEWFDGIKTFIMSGQLADGMLWENEQPLDPRIRKGVTDTEWIHVLSCSWNQSQIRAHCRFFDRPDSKVIAFDFMLGKLRLVVPKSHVFAHRFRYLEIKPNGPQGIAERIPKTWFTT